MENSDSPLPRATEPAGGGPGGLRGEGRGACWESLQGHIHLQELSPEPPMAGIDTPMDPVLSPDQ